MRGPWQHLHQSPRFVPSVGSRLCTYLLWVQDPAHVTNPLLCCPLVPGLSKKLCVSAQDVMMLEVSLLCLVVTGSALYVLTAWVMKCVCCLSVRLCATFGRYTLTCFRAFCQKWSSCGSTLCLMCFM